MGGEDRDGAALHVRGAREVLGLLRRLPQRRARVRLQRRQPMLRAHLRRPRFERTHKALRHAGCQAAAAAAARAGGGGGGGGAGTARARSNHSAAAGARFRLIKDIPATSTYSPCSARLRCAGPALAVSVARRGARRSMGVARWPERGGVGGGRGGTHHFCSPRKSQRRWAAMRKVSRPPAGRATHGGAR
jgi:hypothetical protein